MAQKTNSFDKFWKELKRRKVVHVITVYAATAFVILEVVDMVARPLQLPDWTEAFVIVLLSIGFIISVVVSWVYDITPAGVRKTKPASAVKHGEPATHTVSSGWKIATYISAIIIIGLLAFNFISRRNLNLDISKLEKSIAVIPFRLDSQDTTYLYFINGLMERITTNLQMIKSFRVLSRTSVEQYRNTTKSIPEIARELNVNYVLEGSGQKYGNSLSLNVQLIKAKGKETHLWAKPYEREINEVSDYIRIMSEIAEKIATELKAALTPEEKQLIEKNPTTNLIADDYYKIGREEEGKFPYHALTSSSTIFTLYNPSDEDKQALEIAERMYRTSLKYDSSLALAYSGLASIYWGKNYYKNYFSDNFLDSVLILAGKALSFDDQLPDAYYIRAMYYSKRGLYKQARENFDKTLKLNPNYWLAYYGQGSLFFSEFDYVRAIENYQKAAERHRGSGAADVLQGICLALYVSGFNEKASEYAREALKLETDSVRYYFWQSMFENDIQKKYEFLKKGYSVDSTNNLILEYMSSYYLDVGQFDKSLRFFKKHLEKLKEQGITRVNYLHRIGYLLFKVGLTDSAEYYFNKQIKYCNDAIRLGRDYGVSLAYYDLAATYAFVENKIKAYENLKIFNLNQKMPIWALEYLKKDPLFNSIRNEPEFQQIARDVEAKYQAEHERVRKWLEEHGML